MTPKEVAQLLQNVIDPELGIDIVSLGLLYAVEVDAEQVSVQFAVTSPECPLAEAIAGMAVRRLRSACGMRELTLEVVGEPPWHPGMIDAEGRERLGLPAN